MFKYVKNVEHIKMASKFSKYFYKIRLSTLRIFLGNHWSDCYHFLYSIEK